MSTNFIDDFIQNDYERLADAFSQRTTTYLIENHDHLFEDIIHMMEVFCKKLALLQEQVPIDVGVIQISLLQTSIYYGEPKLRLDAYDKHGVFGGNLLHEEYDFPWLFKYWGDWQEELKKAVVDKHYERYVSQERIRVLMWQKVKLLEYLLLAHVKYQFAKLDSYPWFQKIKREPVFTISIGEFEDWQKTVYGEMPFVDMFLNFDGEPLRYQRYHQLIFKDKVMDNMDLSRIRFIDCHFIHCTITNVKFHDSTFDGCRFHNTEIVGCEFYGSEWKDCLIQKTKFTNCDFCQEVSSFDEPIEDMYRAVLMDTCTLNRVEMKSCNLQGVQLANEHTKDFTIIDEDTDIEEQTGGDES